MSKTLLLKRTYMRRGTVLVGRLVLLLLLRGPAMASAAWTNTGMLALRDGRLTARWLRVEWLWLEPLPKTLDVLRELGVL